jgi:hypothetical protein
LRRVEMIEQYNIFGDIDELPEEVKKPSSSNKYKTMQELHGTKEGFTCKTCEHIYCNQWNKKYYKCSLWHISHSTATDIRLKDTACGLYKPKI